MADQPRPTGWTLVNVAELLFDQRAHSMMAVRSLRQIFPAEPTLDQAETSTVVSRNP